MTTGAGKRFRPIAGSASDPIVLEGLPLANRSPICKRCFETDGVVTTNVVEHRCINDRAGTQFTAFVCAHCLDSGRETRVTCRTFIPCPLTET
jgi:hypothetical protein